MTKLQLFEMALGIILIDVSLNSKQKHDLIMELMDAYTHGGKPKLKELVDSIII